MCSKGHIQTTADSGVWNQLFCVVVVSSLPPSESLAGHRAWMGHGGSMMGSHLDPAEEVAPATLLIEGSQKTFKIQ